MYINLKVHVDGAGISPQMQRKCAYSLKGKWALPEVCVFIGCPAQRHQCAWTALAQALYSPVRSIFKVREPRLPAIQVPVLAWVIVSDPDGNQVAP